MDQDQIPKHVAIIMDGNGRWAEKHSKNRLFGHDAGLKAMKEIVKKSSVLGVEHLTVYAFSTENWKRSQEEVTGIFNLVIKYVSSELQELIDNNVVVDILGDYSALPKKSVASLDKLVRNTSENTGLHFHIALNYGSRAEMLMAARTLANDVADNKISIEDIDEEAFSNRLYTAGTPDPDLVIRTSGEERLSNFLLWQAAYSEYVFSEVLWPDFTPEEYERCIEEYQGRKRRFGGR